MIFSKKMWFISVYLLNTLVFSVFLLFSHFFININSHTNLYKNACKFCKYPNMFRKSLNKFCKPSPISCKNNAKIPQNNLKNASHIPITCKYINCPIFRPINIFICPKNDTITKMSNILLSLK